MAKRNNNDFVGCWMPTGMLTRIDELASKKMSNRSQVLREATMKGLELL